MSHRLIVPVVLLSLTAVYAATAFTYEQGARDIPLAVSALVALLLSVEILMKTASRIGRILRKIFTGSDAIQTTPGDGTTQIAKEIGAFAWIIGFLILAIVVGFYIAIPIYVFGYLRFYARKSLLVSALPAVVLVGLLYLLFQVMLGYEIFSGLIAGDYL